MDITKFYRMEGEKPLDNLKDDGGFAAIFRTVACVGDSLSSGEFESKNEDGTTGYHDLFEYSWGQYLARMTGAKVYNFSRGGMTAKEYCESFAEANGMWDREKAAQCYLIALGCNDLFGLKMPLGSVDDIDLNDYRNNNTETFAGWMGRIIQRYREIQPKSRIFLITMPREDRQDDSAAAGQTKLMYELASFFPFTYVIDLHTYAPIYDAEFKKNFYLEGHMNPAGYLLTAKMIGSYMDYIIRNAPEDFTQTGFIGTEFHSVTSKW